MSSLTLRFQKRWSFVNEKLVSSASTSARAPSSPTLLELKCSTSNDKLFLSASASA
eukprot:CAMPEP_0198323932 /NCGR_PEP_ID=MMETSP1450-20131203/12047_1 /TAXON_ID=753684 ORGANISM="Madagascaria erythrocladiodes, Strain CCMP3234" /NCGR_SAMPLE_ID=MMETSP1450 /ASSEMBLY_ACC=CAM_ASM_001115 /LENGTH=55 /DNA_ID=CAMNT_0044027677 /DNA_START=6 /DNA_END=170 /DNA_ORIENTATION=+